MNNPTRDQGHGHTEYIYCKGKKKRKHFTVAI